MKHEEPLALVTTLPERCRVCYTCVRECPAKAIRIRDGQAEVLPARCIGCGNCVRVCSQHAKQVLAGLPAVKTMLDGAVPTLALVAPSFAAAFPELAWRRFVGMCRAAGFDGVYEVAFGADLVAAAYRRLLETGEGSERWIATSCPAIVAYVERHLPELVDRLAPIVSPMIAMARVVRALHDGACHLVFLGPCVAKKGEAASLLVDEEVDEVLTFDELRALFDATGLQVDGVEGSDFDPPRAGRGGLFPVSRGMLQAAGIEEDLTRGQVTVADGRVHFVEALKEFASGDLDVKLLEILACSGCIHGPAMSVDSSHFRRRQAVADYVREALASRPSEDWLRDMETWAGVDLARVYQADDQRLEEPDGETLRRILEGMGKLSKEDELDCGACGYETCREHAVAIHKGLAERSMCLPHTIERLHRLVGDLADANEGIASTRKALSQSERLASMGQLAAGIAHEVNNPLGVVLMYAHLVLEEAGRQTEISEDLQVIAAEADRCKRIVAGLMDFSSEGERPRRRVAVDPILDRVQLETPPPDGITFTVEGRGQGLEAVLDEDQIQQLLVNLVKNAYAAMTEGDAVVLRAWERHGELLLEVEDTGSGIPEGIRSKIFEPFFSTKAPGKGTGLGLAVCFGFVKMHGGRIELESNDDVSTGPTGTCFRVRLPRDGKLLGETLEEGEA